MYLGPSLPRWLPQTVDDVRSAIDDGTLAERHWLDVKAEVGTTDSGRKGLAKDLAAFANDGGGLLIGVREDKRAGTLTVDPVPLEGLAETVDQIARSRCDPPVYVVCHPLVAGAVSPGVKGQARGVLLVEIPPSPSAPHMVDGRYYGRGDTTNHHLNDENVARLHAVRTARQTTAEELVAVEVARDPVPAGARENSHLYVVAQPLAGRLDLATNFIASPELAQTVLKVGADFPPAQNVAAPNWNSLTLSAERRAWGVGFASFGLTGRQFRSDRPEGNEDSLLDVEIQDDGRISLFCGRASGGPEYVIDVGVVSLTRNLVTLAGRLGAQTGYAGQWVLAVGVTDLRGKVSVTARNTIRMGPDYPRFTADFYCRGTEAVTTELLNQPGAVTRRAVDRLLRALGKDQDGQINDLLADSVPKRPTDS